MGGTSKLIQQHHVSGLPIDLGSDWHLQVAHLGTAINHLRENQQSETLVAAGDLFDSDEEDRSPEINELFRALSESYRHIVYTPGNHCLRGRENPWASFDFPENVLCPKGAEPIVHQIDGSRLLIANMFYDLEFIDPAILGLTTEEVKTWYQTDTDDGRHFLGGNMESFPAMTKAVANLLTPDIDILISHVPPHPSLVTFRVPEINEAIGGLSAHSGLHFICNPEDDEKQAPRKNLTAEGFRRYWNLKSLVMGSNPFAKPQANFRDGLSIIHGHNHRIDLADRMIAGRNVHTFTHQPNPWSWRRPNEFYPQ